MFTDSPTFPFRVNKSIKSNISAADLRELGNNLWPADCQTCGQPFDGELPALVINDLAVMALASLHHAKCSPPQWNGDHVINASTAPYLSYRTMTALIPGENSNGQPYAMPTVIVNPALEQVMLRREGSSWSVATLTHYGENCGLTGVGGSGASARNPALAHGRRSGSSG
ncbi:hypothetical protein IU510_29480 [Nocardia cyriacigeorgica]|uniref:hypothetical protein n=1 Tax=Nocardia cyriacigeorgica TaxID=135487 RepID=UPI0018952313|nr:hypothetical protein [Nocardia cyriacigeorgica]MBF6102151.1 hypothetical protein [Nocardia cyriacigeorgica]MBF6347356.1 hypothetical protein [Nocardia cyriacigeorgica]